MVISVASGKGGTGKTTIATNLALSLGASRGSHLPGGSASRGSHLPGGNGVQFLDCDVEEPNAHLFLTPQITETESVGISYPQIDEEKCNYCGKCAEICTYNAIAVVHPVRNKEIRTGKSFPQSAEEDKTDISNGVKNKVLIFPELCHGCGGCSLLCPQGAIFEINKEIGIIESGKAGKIDFVHGILNVGEALHTPVVRAVKKRADESKTVIIDVAPGTSCPVIEAVKHTDFCILVTEPTPFGLNDLILAVEALRKLGIPFGVIINRADVGDKKVIEYCRREKIPILMNIPVSREIAVAYSKGVPIIDAIPEYKNKFKELFDKVSNLLSNR